MSDEILTVDVTFAAPPALDPLSLQGMIDLLAQVTGGALWGTSLVGGGFDERSRRLLYEAWYPQHHVFGRPMPSIADAMEVLLREDPDVEWLSFLTWWTGRAMSQAPAVLAEQLTFIRITGIGGSGEVNVTLEVRGAGIVIAATFASFALIVAAYLKRDPALVDAGSGRERLRRFREAAEGLALSRLVAEIQAGGLPDMPADTRRAIARVIAVSATPLAASPLVRRLDVRV